MKLSRRTFTRNMLGSLLTFSLVKSLDEVDVLAYSVKPIVRKWLVDMEDVTRQLRRGQLKTIEWQGLIESLLSRVDLNDLLTAIDFDRLAKAAVFPEDHESAEELKFSRTKDLPKKLSFIPFFYAMKKGTAIVPHGHRNMTSMHMMLKGQAHGWQFERVADEAQYLTIRPTNDSVQETGAVTTSTTSPFFSSVRSGTCTPLILAATVWSPTSLWIEYAKSTTVAPRGMARIWLRGVNT